MIAAVGVGERVQGVVGVDAEFVGRDENRPGCAEREVAAARAHRAGADRGGGIVARARHDAHRFRQAQRFRRVRCERAHDLVAFKQSRHLIFGNAADVQHLRRPVLVRHVQQQHPGRVRVVAAVDAGELVVYIILRQHDPRDPRKILRLILAHPQELRRGKARKGNVRRPRGELLLADGVVEVDDLFGRSAVVPEDGRADDTIALIQRDQAVHLAACADARDQRRVKARQQLGNAGHNGLPPVLRPLLRPARMREAQRIVMRHGV